MSGGSVATGINNNENPVMLTAGVDNDDPFLLGGTPKGGAGKIWMIMLILLENLVVYIHAHL